jgi:CRISPR-associated protein Cas6
MHQFMLTPGCTIPEDGGYAVLSGLSRQFPFVHGSPSIQIAPIRGQRAGNGRITTDRSSILHVRGLSPEDAARMSGGWFQVHGTLIGMGPATDVPVRPARTLTSRIVVFDDTVDPGAFMAALARVTPVGCSMSLGRRRSVRIKGRTFIGYGVRLDDLTPDDSTHVQITGIGRFTSMGCGVFAPARGT